MRIARVTRQGVIGEAKKKKKGEANAHSMRDDALPMRLACAERNRKLRKASVQIGLDAADEIIIQINSSVLFLGA